MSAGRTRRDFLLRAGATGVVALGAGQLPASAAPRGDRPGQVSELTAFRDPLPIPRRVVGDRVRGGRELTVRLRPLRMRLHSQLPPSTLWGFDGRFPGPLIETRRGERLRVHWVNDLSRPYPLPVVEVPFDENADPFQWDRPGAEGTTPREDVAALPPWTSVHLHGAFSNGNSDGWAEDAVLPGYTQPVEYGNDQPATTLWYHDHAMHITRWNVMSGLLGMYLIRDREEDALRLPSGDREVPLVICDRNFDLDERGRLDGTVLHKTTVMRTEPLRQVRSFAGPFTLVNGAVWPHKDVEPGWYRFRMLNASNTRPYDVQLVDEQGAPVPPGTILLIGTDSGLLPAPVDMRDGFGLASSERADILVNFRAFAGRKLRLRNVNYDPGPWPDFLEFRVGGRPGHEPFVPPGTLARSPAKVTESLADKPDRMIMLTPVGVSHSRMWEMKRVDPPPGPFPVDGIVQVREKDGSLTTWQRQAYRWHDPVQFVAEAGGWERWRFLNLDFSGWPHPMHLHVCTFFPLSREYYDIDGFQFLDLPHGGIGGGTGKPVAHQETRQIQPYEWGWKDVINVAAGECVELAVNFAEVTGKFVYHCHMLEHEDMGMMRPFLVQPKEVIAIAEAMEHELGHGH